MAITLNGSTGVTTTGLTSNGIDDNATSTAITIDASENVGINTSSPAFPLDVSTNSSTTNDAVVVTRLSANTTGTAANNFGAALNFSAEDASGSLRDLATINGIYTNATNRSSALTFKTRSNLGALTTQMTIDSSGNVFVGTSGAVLPESADVSGEAGISLDASNYISAARYQNIAGYFNRIGSDGTIIDFRKSGSTVGSIQTGAGGYMHIVGGNTTFGSGIAFNNQTWNPTNASGTITDDHVKLGDTGSRFTDLYLSGGVYLGGTGSANKLDDVEYGVWNPANSQITLAASNGDYVKVGRMCTVTFRLIWPTNSNTVQARISLPFACASHGSAAHMAGLAIAFTTYTATPSGGVYSNQAYMEFFKGGSNALTNADLSGKQINGSVTYITNS
mgnify:CR=1 FL=1